GDEHGLAWAHQTPRPKRSKFTLIVGAIFIAFVVLGALPLVLRSGDGQLVQPNCTTPAVATGPAKIKPGTNFAWQAAARRRRSRRGLTTVVHTRSRCSDTPAPRGPG